MTYLREHRTRAAGNTATPQSEPIPGREMVANNAGGYGFQIDDLARARRFLILGSEGGTYYQSQREITAENVSVISDLLSAGRGHELIALITDVSVRGLAAKQDPTLFALAMAASYSEDKTVRVAALEAAVQFVCRTASQFQSFIGYCEQFRGWGRALRATVREWMRQHGSAYQLLKYQQREGWANRDLLRLAHPVPLTNEEAALWQWAAKQEEPGGILGGPLPEQIEEAQKLNPNIRPADAARIIREARLPREAVPTELLAHAAVWDALLDDMPVGALVRNLATMTRVGLLGPLAEGNQRVIDVLTNGDKIRASRIHPLQVLNAYHTYRAGAGFRGSNTWSPVPQIVDAVEGAFYTSFEFVVPAGKRTLLALDVSSSMGQPAAGSQFSCYEAEAVMAMVTARTEPQYHVMGFAREFRELPITANSTLAEATEAVRTRGFGGTDCALPMTWARANGVLADTFVVYTDNETWAGKIHPSEALTAYRAQTGIPARLAVVAFTATPFSIADPNDPGMLDFVGFDASAPAMLSAFSRGDV